MGGEASKVTHQLGAEDGPHAWDANTSHHPSMRYLDVIGLRVKYKGPGSDDRDAASIRSNKPIPANCPVYYFEIEIINKGRDGYIGIGLAGHDVKLDRLPGWEPHSYGYHGDDGHVFNGRGTGRPYGPVFTTGDWVGVIYNRIESTISFTKKGFNLGIAFQNVPERLLYPTVGFRTPDEEIVANFGNDLEKKPFKGNYAEIVESVQTELYRKILSTALPRDGGEEEDEMSERDVYGELVFDYLDHHGYWETASLVAEDVLRGKTRVSQSSKEESKALYAVTDHVMAGEIDEAMVAAEELCPGVLEKNPGVHFALKCQKLCELIQQKKDEEAMVYGREELSPVCSSPDDRKLLDASLTLFAYSDARSSPSGYLLGTAHKSELAASLIRALRNYLGKREVSSLENIFRQACTAHQVLKEEYDAAPPLLNVNEFVDNAVEIVEKFA